ncbi:hypothetical protein MMC07_009619 [Pseudocyphellaria aurata]|nr:hypothetical protein [Pseudocyphellaria aurata]
MPGFALETPQRDKVVRLAGHQKILLASFIVMEQLYTECVQTLDVSCAHQALFAPNLFISIVIFVARYRDALEGYVLNNEHLPLLLFAQYFPAVAEISILDCVLLALLLRPPDSLHLVFAGVEPSLLLFLFCDQQLLSLLIVSLDLEPVPHVFSLPVARLEKQSRFPLQNELAAEGVRVREDLLDGCGTGLTAAFWRGICTRAARAPDTGIAGYEDAPVKNSHGFCKKQYPLAARTTHQVEHHVPLRGCVCAPTHGSGVWRAGFIHARESDFSGTQM